MKSSVGSGAAKDMVGRDHVKARQSPLSFFEDLYLTFKEAKDASGSAIESSYSIGGRSVRLCFAGSALVSGLTPAIEHLVEESPAKPELTICIWDSQSTGSVMPPPPWTTQDYGVRGEVIGYNDGRIHTSFQQWNGLLCLYDSKRNLALFWIKDARELPYYESAAPFLTIFNWWAQGFDSLVVHGGAVGVDGKGVLLAGRGGSGKSTTTLACLGKELSYLGDDYCLVGPGPTVYSLYNTAKVDQKTLKMLPHLQQAVSRPGRLDGEKTILLLNSFDPATIVKSLELKALLLPHIGRKGQTRTVKGSKASGLMALAPSTIFQLTGRGESAFKSLSNLVKEIPCYHLELGTDLDAVPGVIHELLVAT